MKETNKLVLLVCCIIQFPLAASAAGNAEELLVTAVRTDKTVIPGASLRRPADHLLQRIKVSSDSPEPGVRTDEIIAALRLLQNAATRDGSLELSMLLDYGVVVPLNINPAAIKLRAGSRSQTSEVVIGVKTRAAPGADNPIALFAKLREFPTRIKPAGRAAIDLMGDIELTIVNPRQFREAVIRLYAADTKTVTSALGAEYRVVTRGIDRQLQWLRDGMTDVVIFIPYEYDVVPVDVASSR
jgi:hypothetical protein